MKRLPLLVFALVLSLRAGAAAAPPPINPASVAVLYNTSDADSEKIARAYLAARAIPESNLIGLPMPLSAEITRQQFETTIKAPLVAVFNQRQWWQWAKDPNGKSAAVKNQIRLLVTIRGVPLKIAHQAPATPPPPAAPGAATPFTNHNEAAVDSELCILGVEGLSIEGPLRNQYFQSTTPFSEAKMPFLLLVGRIDAHTPEVCLRMIRDAVATERTGLWGRAFVDIAKKIPEGDKWLENIITANTQRGIPTVVDRNPETFPSNYPMTQASLYYGWYSGNRDGPLLNPGFRFKQGAVAIHIHSFSAVQMRNPEANWSAALLAHGAAATVGNVYEPYLGPSHNLDVLHERLLAGFSLAEASYMALPVLSWQSIVLGDPLYRPFAHLESQGGEVDPADREFRAINVAKVRWKDDSASLQARLREAALLGNSGTLYEALGLIMLDRGLTGEAMTLFNSARISYAQPADQIRQDLHLADIDRAAGRKAAAVTRLREISGTFVAVPERGAATALLQILDPQPKRPAKPAP
jgi:uncharacterized protein (TIGR03790 family)